MRIISVLLVLFFLAHTLPAQVKFPAAFQGKWKGTLQWHPLGNPPREVEMQLHVLPTDSAHQYTWRIIYGSATQDDRPYLLKPVDTAGLHWIINERNGIMIDSYWINDRLISSFSVGKVTITDSYWINGDEMIVEFYSTGINPISTTGKGTEDSPTVKSYPVGSFQRAVLKKIP